MCNVSDYGGSGIFGPLRTSGERQTLINLGKGIDTFGFYELDLDGLNQARSSENKDLHLGNFMRKPNFRN